MNSAVFTGAILGTLLLTACSSGSDSDSSSGNNSETPTATESVNRVSLMGIAIKGLATGARVAVYTPGDDGTFATTPLTTATTDASGKYQLTFDEGKEPSGLVQIRLGYQTGAMLQCDNINAADPGTACLTDSGYVASGDFYDMPEDFELVSYANFDSTRIDNSGNHVINLTALTALAGSLLNATEQPTLSDILLANTQVRAILGLPANVSLTDTTPDNLTDNTDSGDAFYGAMNTAFLRIARDSGTSLTEVLDDYASKIQELNGQITIKSADADQPTLKRLVDAADAFDTADDQLAALQSAIAAAENEQITDIIPPVVGLGNNRTVTPGTSVTVTASTEQGEPVSYSWSTSMPDVALASGTTSQTFTAPATEGNYSLTVTVTDAAGISSATRITIQVKAATVVGSDLDGTYYGMSLMTRIEEYVPDGTATMSVEKDDANRYTIATGSQGTQLSQTSGILSEDFWAIASLDTFGTLSSERDDQYSDSFTRPLTVQASGIAVLSVEGRSGVDTEDTFSWGYVDDPVDYRFIPIGQGILWAAVSESHKEYGVTAGGAIDYTTQTLAITDANNFILAKKASTGAIQAGDFVGFELFSGVGTYGTVGGGIYDTRFSFDSSANLTTTSIARYELYGKLDTGFSFVLNTVADTGTLDNVTLDNGRLDFSDSDTTAPASGYDASLVMAADQSALVLRNMYWDNTGTDASFTASDADFRTVSSTILLRTPDAPVDLSNTTFTIGSNGYLAREYVAGDMQFGTIVEFGSLLFGTDSITVTLNGQAGLATTSNGGSNATRSLEDTSSSYTITGLSTLVTDAEGCLDLDVSDTTAGTRLCTDGETLLMRRYNTTTTNGFTGRVIGLYVGTRVSN